MHRVLRLQRGNVWLRFGGPAAETVFDRWRRRVDFAAGAVCSRVKRIGNDYGTALWQLMVLQAPDIGKLQALRIAGVTPGALILLQASSKERVIQIHR